MAHVRFARVRILKDIHNHSTRVQTIPDLTDSTFSLPQHPEQTNVSASQRLPQSQGRYMDPNFRHVYILVLPHVSSYKERILFCFDIFLQFFMFFFRKWRSCFFLMCYYSQWLLLKYSYIYIVSFWAALPLVSPCGIFDLLFTCFPYQPSVTWATISTLTNLYFLKHPHLDSLFFHLVFIYYQ